MKFIESEIVELKREFSESIEKEIVSFLNANGGTIYIGIGDLGNVIGVHKSDEILRNIADIVTTKILPIATELVKATIELIDDKLVIVIKVNKGIKQLYYIKKFGHSPNGCYVRIGTSCRSLTDEEISKRHNADNLNKISITDIPSKKNLTFGILKNYYTQIKKYFNELTFEDNLNLRTSDGGYNYLAELLADENDVSIKVARFEGIDKSKVLQRNEYGFTCLLLAMQKDLIIVMY